MHTPDRILCAVDFSESSQRALSQAVALAGQHEAPAFRPDGSRP